MSHREDFLLEIHTEELPPKVLVLLGSTLQQEMEKQLAKAKLAFSAARYYATPRRLAVLIAEVDTQQAAQIVERKGPALNAAYDKEGKPTPACLGFARSCGIEPSALQIIKNDNGEWVGYTETVAGKPTAALLPAMVQQALTALPIPKRMRWGENPDPFIRPVHAVLMLLGKNVVESTILGQQSDRLTYGHRFHHPQALKITQPQDYAKTLENKGYVLADFEQRKALIRQQAAAVVQENIGKNANILFDEDLLNEVTALVEWPVAICGRFDERFLSLPKPVLISSMQDHQRYFPIVDDEGHLRPHFAAIINIESRDLARVVTGNERVLRARLSDAAFFFETDQKHSLESRVEALKGIVFQAKLGTLYDKTQRLMKMASHIAATLNQNTALATRAASLAKADLTTGMVGEFPELQGTMGRYYALHDKEPEAVAFAIEEHYRPRFSGDELPKTPLGRILALADRIDTLISIFGINQSPTGDKDPFGLRRAALGILRILIEEQLDLDLAPLLAIAVSSYDKLDNQEAPAQVLRFILERMKGLCQEQAIDPDVFAAVAALNVTGPYDIYSRIQAVQTFKGLPQAEALAMANKRVSNILAQYTENLSDKNVDPRLFESAEEKELFHSLEAMKKKIEPALKDHHYPQIMMDLATLRDPIDKFFDHVLVMAEDKKVRENRLLLLKQLRELFLIVADIALLVGK